MSDYKAKTQELSSKIDECYKIENDPKSSTLAKLDARENRLKLTRELNDLLTEAIAKLD